MKNEVQIGDKIYRITEASVKVFTRNGKLLDEQSNQIEVYDFITKEFVQMQPQANGRSSAFDVWYYQPVNEVPFSTHYIGYRWYKTNVGFIGKRYYYQNKFLTQASINSFGAVAYYFQFTGTSCICQYPPSTVPPEYTYNSSGMTIDVGWSTHGWEANNGVNLGVGLIMKWNSSSTILHNLSTFL